MLNLQLRFSRTLGALLVGAHLASLALLWITPLPSGVQFAASLLLLASGLFYLRRDCLLLAPGSIVSLRFDQEGACSYQARGGEWFEATLLGSSLVTPWLSVLNFKPETSRGMRSVVLFPDSIDAEDYRKLRVLLRWGRKKEKE
jgi:toxin CptA